ncbi:MAG: tetratricopeptide repeat protein [Phycisphaerae bacterium]
MISSTSAPRIRRSGAAICSAAIVLALFGAAALRADDPKQPDDSALREFQAASGLLQRGLHELAEAEYRKFLAAHDDHPMAPAARYALAVCLQRRGQAAEAIKVLTPIAKRDDFEFAAESRLLLAQCQSKQGQFADAAKTCESLIRGFPKHELADDAAALRIEALQRDGKPEAAVESALAFTRQFADSPLAARVALLAAMAEMEQENWSVAAARLERLLSSGVSDELELQAAFLAARCYDELDNLPRAAERYQQALRGETNRVTPDALLGLAGIRHRQKDGAATAELIERLLKEQPDGPLTSQALLLGALAAFDADEFDQADTLLAKLAKRDDAPRDHVAYWQAKCALRRGDSQPAADALGATIREFPQSKLLPEMRYDRAAALAQAGANDDAVAVLQEFLDAHEQHALRPEALHLLAALEHRRRDFARSREHCDAFLRAFAKHPLAAAVSFLAAENAFLAGDDYDALAGFRAFLATYPDDAQAAKARYRLGMTLLRAGKNDEALSLLITAAADARRDEALRPALLALGDLRLRRSEWDDAEKTLSEFLAAAGDSASADEALLKRGVARQRLDRHEDALRDFDQLLERFAESPHAAHALFERGQSLLALQRYEPAAEAFRAVLQRKDAERFQSPARMHLGALALRADDPGGAIKQFAAVVRDNPDSDTTPQARLQLAIAQLAAREFADAEKSLRTYLKARHDDAQTANARAYLAIAVARQDRAADAIEIMDQVGGITKTGVDPALRVRLGVERAWCLRSLKRSKEASEAYREIAENAEVDGATRSQAALDLAEIEAQDGQLDAATARLRALNDAAEREKRPWDDFRGRVAYRLGACEFQREKFEAAVELLEPLIKEKPDHALVASASAFCGEACLRLGRHRQAVEHLGRVVESHRDDPSYATCLLRLGDALAGVQQWERSELSFARYLREFADSEQAYRAQFGLGWARENLGRQDEAIEAYRAVVEKHKGPTAARAQFQIGECLFAKKKLDDAVRELLKVDILYAYPEWSAAALFEAGRCFAEMGKSAEARTQFAAVVDKYADTKWAEMARKRMADLGGGALPGHATQR